MAGPVPQKLREIMYTNPMASFDGIPIFGITQCEPDTEIFAGTGRSMGGKGRFDFVAAKNMWRVETTYIPLDKVNALYNHLVEISWSWGDWWCWLMGPQEVTVRARIENFRRRPLGKIPDLVAMSFTVVEQ